MRNWLGQDIVPGSVVYRGARDGNSSTYKVGTVVKVDEDTKKVRVDWQFGPKSYNYRTDPAGNHERVTGQVGIETGSGTSDINTLVLVNIDINRLQAHVDLDAEWRSTNMSTQEYEARSQDLDNQNNV